MFPYEVHSTDAQRQGSLESVICTHALASQLSKVISKWKCAFSSGNIRQLLQGLYAL